MFSEEGKKGRALILEKIRERIPERSVPGIP